MQTLPIEMQADIAELFKGKMWAYTPVFSDGECNAASLGVAVANQTGYHPIRILQIDTWENAARYAEQLNDDRGIDLTTATRIVASTMGNDR